MVNLQLYKTKCLTEENEITGGQSTAQTFQHWGPMVLDCPQIPDEEHHPILWEELEAALKALKMENSQITAE